MYSTHTPPAGSCEGRSTPTGTPRRERGLTLVEAVIALVLLLGCVSLVLPWVRHKAFGHGVADMSQDLMADLDRARREALARREPVELAPLSGDWRQGWTVRAGEQLLLQREGPGPAARVDDAPTLIRFGPQGRLLNAERVAHLTIRPDSPMAGDAPARCVRVDAAGRARTRYGTCL